MKYQLLRKITGSGEAELFAVSSGYESATEACRELGLETVEGLWVPILDEDGIRLGTSGIPKDHVAGKITPILVIVGGRVFLESAEGILHPDGDLALIAEEAFHSLF